MIDVRHHGTTHTPRPTLKLLVRLVLVAGAILCLLLLFRPAAAAVGAPQGGSQAGPGEINLQQGLGISGRLERVFQQGMAASFFFALLCVACLSGINLAGHRRAQRTAACQGPAGP